MYKNTLKIVLVILIISGGITYYGFIAKNSELTFDGAIYSQGALSLLKYGVYANYLYDKEVSQFRFSVFSQGMIGQYPFNIPIILLFGISNFSLQVTNLLFFLLTALLLYYFVIKISSNYLLALLSLILYFTFPGMNFFGLGGLGEFPSFFYIVLTACFLYKAFENPKFFPVLGLSLFFAFNTKFFLILLFPVLLLIIAYFQVYKKRGTINHLLWFVLLFIGPIIFLHILYCTSYGLTALKSFYIIDFNHGIRSNLTQNLQLKLHELDIIANFKTAFQDIRTTYWSPYFYYFSLILTYGISIDFLWKDIRRKYSADSRSLGKRSESGKIVLLFLLLSSLCYMSWFHFGWMTHGVRRMVPIFLLNEFLSILAFGLWSQIRFKNSKKLIGVIGLLIFIPLLWVHGIKFLQNFEINIHQNTAVQDRQEMVTFISKLPEDKRVFGLGWWQAPRLSLFSSKIFLNFENNQRYREGYLVFDDVALEAIPKLIDETLDRYGSKYYFELVKKNNHYVIYKWIQKN